MASPSLTENAARVLEARYLRRDSAGKVAETPAGLFERVAKAVAYAELLLGNAREADRWEEKFHNLLASLDFLPNSPTLMNAGTALGQLSACFVLPVEDTMEGIFGAVKNMALVQRTGGGTGFSFSRLRPKGGLVASSGGEAAGPVSFMQIFDCATENIKQGGRRRGANMGVLRADHPDILDFIEAKRRGGLRNFNLSVGATDAFMRAVRAGDAFTLRHPGTAEPAGEVQAKQVFEAIAQAAWETGDPGLLFLDVINRAQPTPQLGPIEGTNPCGEIPLLPYESCNLGSINLAHMLRRGEARPTLDWGRLRETVATAVRFLDDVIEVGRYPVAEIQRMTLGNRKIGLGVMGFAEMLIALGVSYASDEAVDLAGCIMQFIADEALRASQDLAVERGVFPFWKGSVHEARGLRVRNATRTAIAPTGTIGIIAGTSPSIEPLFALAYRRSHVLGEETLYEVNPIFQAYLQEEGRDAEAIIEKVWQTGALSRVEGVPPRLKRLFVTALEIAAEQHLAIQAAFQRQVDNSVSKTVNLSPEATPGDIVRIYMRAWDLGLKGITIYRYGSKMGQVLELGLGEAPHHFEHGAKCDPEECRV